MQGDSNPSYSPDAYIKPGPNLQFLTWLILLGLPAMLLFLIFSKIDEHQSLPNNTPAAIERPAHE